MIYPCFYDFVYNICNSLCFAYDWTCIRARAVPNVYFSKLSVRFIFVGNLFQNKSVSTQHTTRTTEVVIDRDAILLELSQFFSTEISDWVLYWRYLSDLHISIQYFFSYIFFLFIINKTFRNKIFYKFLAQVMGPADLYWLYFRTSKMGL